MADEKQTSIRFPALPGSRSSELIVETVNSSVRVYCNEFGMVPMRDLDRDEVRRLRDFLDTWLGRPSIKAIHPSGAKLFRSVATFECSHCGTRHETASEGLVMCGCGASFFTYETIAAAYVTNEVSGEVQRHFGVSIGTATPRDPKV